MSGGYTGPDLSWYCSWCEVRHYPGDICWSVEDLIEAEARERADRMASGETAPREGNG